MAMEAPVRFPDDAQANADEQILGVSRIIVGIPGSTYIGERRDKEFVRAEKIVEQRLAVFQR